MRQTHRVKSPLFFCGPQVRAPVNDRSDWELFYAYPSLSAPVFFAAATEEVAALPGARQDAGSAAGAYEDLHELAKALQVAGQFWLSGGIIRSPFCSSSMLT